MRKFFSNMRVKLILAFAIILIVPTNSIGALSYETARNAVEKEILAGINESINLLNTTIDNTINPKIQAVDFFSKNVRSQHYKGDSSPELREKFDQYVQVHPEVQSIYVGTTTGLFVQEPKVAMADDYDPRKRNWYIDAMANKGEVIISEPYVSAGTDHLVVTISKILNDGSGVMAVNLFLSHIQELTNQVNVGVEGYALLLDSHKKFIAHPTNEGGSEATESFYDQMYKQKDGNFEYFANDADQMMSFVTNDLTGWKIAGNVYSSEISDAAAPILHKTILIIAAALILSAIAVYFIIKSIMSPIKELKMRALTISHGDLTEDIVIKSNDEIGHLGNAFNEMQASLRTLVQRVEFNADQVAAAAEQLTASAEQTSDATEHVALSIQEVASSADKQTSKVDQNAQALEEISNGVTLIADSSLKVSELSRQTSKQAEIGGNAVTSTVNQMNSIYETVTESNTMMKSLYEHSKKVSTILDAITDIAEQTNLLSLNAAIEAARAGEHGKGFAVVADEVRKLAEQSQHSAKEIGGIIQRIQTDMESSVQIMARITDDVQVGVQVSNEAIEKFNDILHSTVEITPQMEEVSTTAQQIATSIQAVATTANELALIARENASTSDGVAASTEEQLASMEEISASAQELSKMAEELRESISQFKH